MGSDRKENLNPPAEPHIDYRDQPMMQGYMGIRMPNAPTQAGNDREEVLKVYPKAYRSSDGTIRTPIHRSNITYGEFLGMDWADARSQLPNAPATLTDTDGFPEPPLSKTRNWKCLRCPFEVPYSPSWGVMSDALEAHYKEQHPDAMPNAPATQTGNAPNLGVSVRLDGGLLLHPMPSRTVVPESADKTPRPYHGPCAPEPVGHPIPVNEKFLFYRDDEGDYIFEGTRPHEHIAVHGATVEQAYLELLGMLELRKQMPATQGRCADHCVGEACPETDCPVKPVEQGEPIDPCPNCGQSPCSPSCKYYDPEFDAPSETELPPGICPRCGIGHELSGDEGCVICISVPDGVASVLKQMSCENQQLRKRCKELAEKYKEVAELQLADEASVKNLQQRYLSLSRAVGKPPSSSRSAEHFADILKQRVEAAEKSAAELQQELELIMATEVSEHSNPLVALNDLLKVNTALRLENANLKSTQFWSNRFPCPITTTTIDGVEYYLKHECLRMFHDLKRDNAQKDKRIAELTERCADTEEDNSALLAHTLDEFLKPEKQ